MEPTDKPPVAGCCEALRHTPQNRAEAVDKHNPRWTMTEQDENFDPCEGLTVKAAAALLHVSEPLIRAFLRAGDLPSVELAGCRRILRGDLESFLVRRRRHDFRPLKQTPRRWRRDDDATRQGEPPTGEIVPY